MNYEIIFLVWLHFFADFVLQSDKVAKTKSTCNMTLLLHVLLYGVCLLWFGLLFAAVNAAMHFATDWVTSRLTTHFWKQNRRHAFFVVIGADQAIHMTCLLLTYFWITK